jgi:indolepyruvate decarboxylase
VDRAIAAALRLKRPVYIEIASSLWREALPLPTGGRLDAPVTISTAARTAARQAALAVRDRVRAGARPALLLGEEIARRGLSADAAALVRKTGLPWATTLLGKGAIAEATPRFSGVHDGRRSPSRANAVLDRADVLIGLGCVLSLDHLALVQDGRIDRLTLALDGTLRTGRGRRNAVDFSGLLEELGRLEWPARTDWAAAIAGPQPQPAPANSEAGLRHDEVFAEIRRAMDDQAARGTVLVADTNLSTHPAADLTLGAKDGFVCGAAWKSIGHSLGVALGIATAGSHPLVVCGDGGFQTIAQALSTLARQRARATVLVIDNGHYAVEQLIVNRPYFTEGCASPNYLDLNRWNYAAVARGMGVQHAVEVTTPTELRRALATAATTAGPSLISARVKARDLPAELRAS